jgi:hypothetical protein
MENDPKIGSRWIPPRYHDIAFEYRGLQHGDFLCKAYNVITGGSIGEHLVTRKIFAEFRPELIITTTAHIRSRP